MAGLTRSFLLLLLGGCAPSDDELRALGEARLGTLGRSVPIGFLVPSAEARSCCCPADQRWFDLATRPETCEVYPDAAEGERYYRGSSYLDPACLTSGGFLEARTVRRQVVRCAAIACEGDPSPAAPPPEEQVQVFVPTPALEALRKEGGEADSTEYFVGYDGLGTLHERKRTGFSTVEANFQLKEDPTPLDACVIERRSRRPSNNRKLDFEFRREDGAWR